MANLKQWVLKNADPKTIEGVVIGDKDWGDDNAVPKGSVLSWEEAEKYLDYEFDAGYGCVDCHAIYVWTPTVILFVSRYDGATEMNAIPRNPACEMPIMPGGG